LATQRTGPLLLNRWQCQVHRRRASEISHTLTLGVARLRFRKPPLTGNGAGRAGAVPPARPA
jgi:hypothetical protein